MRDKRQGYGIYMMPDNNTYSGSWYQGKQHGFGCIFTKEGHLKYGLWQHGQKILKVTTDQASQIQDGNLDVRKLVTESKLRDPEQYWADVKLLTNKFEPFGIFPREQASFELKKKKQKEDKNKLGSLLR